MEQCWNGTDGGKVVVLGEQPVRVQICPPQRLTWNQTRGHCVETTATNCLCHGAALTVMFVLGSLSYVI